MSDVENRDREGRTFTRRDFLGAACSGVLAAAAGDLPAMGSEQKKTRAEGAGVSKKEKGSLNKICGLFAFDPGIDAEKFAASCREWGIRQAILHPGFFRNDSMIRALQKHGVGVWLNVPVFYNPSYLERHPENYAITSQGRKAVNDWCHFVCPSRAEYIQELVGDIRATLSRVEAEIVSLDFIRHFVFWEKVALNGDPNAIEDGCYCAVCLEAFEKASGERVEREGPAAHIRANLKRQWGDWKCNQIATVAEMLFAEMRGLAKDATSTIKTVPWRESDLDGAIRSSAGQDVPRLARSVDMTAPMAFTQILGQTPQWKRGLLQHVREISGKPVLSYVQAEKVIRPEEITNAQFEAEVKEALRDEWAGIVVFEYGQLVGSPKAKILTECLRG